MNKRFFADTFVRRRTRIIVFLALAVFFNWVALDHYYSEAKRESMDRAASRAPGIFHRVDLATAREDEIALLPGVGGARAFEFVRARNRGLVPRSLHDLRAIWGFGPATLERLAAFITLPREPR